MAGEEELNPYAAPVPDAAPSPARADADESLVLADRGTRLGAAILDGCIAMLGAAPGLAVMLWVIVKKANSESLLILFGALLLLGLLGVSSYQWYLIATTGQSLGKRYLHVKIVMADGRAVGFVHGVVLRAWVIALLSGIPYVGSCVSLVDALMILNADRRCLHDRIAGTIVVRA
jgi:uncharacterized RDD family membrane protein YckC